MRALAVGAIIIGNGTWSGISIPAAVEDIDPDPARFCLAPPRVENIDGGIVRNVFDRPQQHGP